MRWLDRITDSMGMNEFQQTSGDSSEGQGSLALCSPWGRKELDMTQQLSNSNSHMYPHTGESRRLDRNGECGLEAEIRVLRPQAKACQEPPEAPGRSEEWASRRASGGGTASDNSFQTSGLQNCKWIHFLGVNPLSLCSFAAATPKKLMWETYSLPALFPLLFPGRDRGGRVSLRWNSPL